MPMTAFYAWQSDTEAAVNHDLIARALQNAIERLNVDVTVQQPERELAVDRDTHGEPGMPAIADTILRKISNAQVFIADLTFVASFDAHRRRKYLPNANVSMELGYAAKAIGFERIICVLNEHYGTPEHLPFDLAHRRYPITYKLAPSASAAEVRAHEGALSNALLRELRSIVAVAAPVPQKDPLAHAVAPVTQSFWGSSGAMSIARIDAFDEEGRPSEHVFWHHGPCAWLRLIPGTELNLGNAQLRRLVESSAFPLRPFGDDFSSRTALNRDGIVVIGYDEDELPSVARYLTQAFRNGELWGLNRAIVEPMRTEPRTLVIPWPETERLFRLTLAAYLGFARDTLRIAPPLHVVAGLAMVNDALLMLPDGVEVSGYSLPARCVQDTVMWTGTIDSWEVSTPEVLQPFFEQVWDACHLEYTDW